MFGLLTTNNHKTQYKISLNASIILSTFGIYHFIALLFHSFPEPDNHSDSIVVRWYFSFPLHIERLYISFNIRSGHFRLSASFFLFFVNLSLETIKLLANDSYQFRCDHLMLLNQFGWGMNSQFKKIACDSQTILTP